MRKLSQDPSALALLTLLVLTMLVLLVFSGWWFLFAKPLQSWLLASLFAFLSTAAAVVLARIIGQQSARRKKESKDFRWGRFLAAYLFLFVLSALGTINSAFVIFEGAQIVRQDIDNIRSMYSNLKIEAQRTLRLESIERRGAQLETELKHLQVEIDNPNGGHFCGVGKSAELVLDKIRTIVPDMPRIRGPGVIRPCDSAVAERLWKAYADSARSTLADDPNYLAFRGPEKTAFLGRLDTNVAAADAVLSQAEGELEDMAAFARSSVQGALANTASAYGSDRAIYTDLIKPETSKIPVSVDISASQDLGSIAAVSHIFARRFFNVRTWFYLIIALLLDFGTIFLFSEVYTRAMDEKGKDRVVADPFTQPGPHPRFLWVNAPINTEKKVIRRV